MQYRDLLKEKSHTSNEVHYSQCRYRQIYNFAERKYPQIDLTDESSFIYININIETT